MKLTRRNSSSHLGRVIVEFFVVAERAPDRLKESIVVEVDGNSSGSFRRTNGPSAVLLYPFPGAADDGELEIENGTRATRNVGRQQGSILSHTGLNPPSVHPRLSAPAPSCP